MEVNFLMSKKRGEVSYNIKGKGQWIFGILAMHSSSLSFWWLFSCTKCKMLQDLVVINTTGKVSILCWCWKRELWGREPFMATRDTRSCQTVQQPNFQNRTRSKLCFLIFFCTCHQALVRPLSTLEKSVRLAVAGELPLCDVTIPNICRWRLIHIKM